MSGIIIVAFKVFKMEAFSFKHVVSGGQEGGGECYCNTHMHTYVHTYTHTHTQCFQSLCPTETTAQNVTPLPLIYPYSDSVTTPVTPIESPGSTILTDSTSGFPEDVLLHVKSRE